MTFFTQMQDEILQNLTALQALIFLIYLDVV